MSVSRLVDEGASSAWAGASSTGYAVLGPLEITGPDGPISITGPKERAVLSVLIAWAGEVVGTDRLTDALWGEQPPRSNVKVIHNLVSQLRKALGADAIETQPGGYVLRAGRRRGHQRLSTASCTKDVSTLQAVVGELPPMPSQPPAICGGARRWLSSVLGPPPVRRQLSCRNSIGASSRSWPRLRWPAAAITSSSRHWRRWWRQSRSGSGGGRCSCWRCTGAVARPRLSRAFQRARTALAEVGLEPGPDLVAMERDISLQIDSSITVVRDEEASRGRAGNLPRPATELVGRAQ